MIELRKNIYSESDGRLSPSKISFQYLTGATGATNIILKSIVCSLE